MNKFRASLIGFGSVSVLFLLVYASAGCIDGKVVNSNSIENVEGHSSQERVVEFSPMLSYVIPYRGYNVLREYLSPVESIEFAGKIVGFEIVQPETGLKLQNVVVIQDWAGVYLIYSDKPPENIKQNDRRYVAFNSDEVVIGSNTIVVSERLENINASLTEKFHGEFRINGNPARGFGAGKTEMYRIDLEGKKHYSEGPYQAGRVDWYVVINSNQSIRYSIAGDHSLEELKKIAGTMKKPGWVLVKPKPLPTPPPKSEPVVEGETIQMES